MDVAALTRTCDSLREILAERPDDAIAKRALAELESKIAAAVATADGAAQLAKHTAETEAAELAKKREAAEAKAKRADALRAIAAQAKAEADEATAAAEAAAAELGS